MATQRLLRDATSGEVAALAAKLVRRPTPAVLNTTPPIPCDFVTAVVMRFECSREEAGKIPLVDLRAELSTAVGREHWSGLLAKYDYRIDTAELSDKPARQRNDEPNEADYLIGRKVLAEMTALRPSVESFRKAFRKMHKASDTKLGKLFKILKSERQK